MVRQYCEREALTWDEGHECELRETKEEYSELLEPE